MAHLMRFTVRRAMDMRLLQTMQPVMSKRGAAGDGKMSFTFASPYEVYYNNADVRQVDVPSYSGNFGILANHVPSLAVIKPGVVTVFEADTSKRFFVSSGTISINEDSSVQVLAEEAVPIEWIDGNAARDVLSSAQAALSKAASEQEKAEAQIQVEVAEALVKASE